MERAPVDQRASDVGGPSAREIRHLRLINGPKNPRQRKFLAFTHRD